ncbi:MAG: ISAs1 family transposase [Mycobacterium sp.]
MLFEVSALWQHLAALSDARRPRGKRYPLPLVLLLVVLAKLGGEDRPSGIADWVAHRRQALQTALGIHWPRMPHHNTYRRVLAEAVDPNALDAAVGAVLRAQPGVGRSVLVSIDGKTVRGTITDEAPRGQHLLAAYLPAEGVVLMQVAAGEKEHEITVAPQLLDALDLRGNVVVGDAMHTQRALSAQIVAAGGDYLWIAKENQPTLRADIADLFAIDARTVAGGRVAQDRRTVTMVDTGHGRQERRTLTASRDLKGYSEWPGLDQVFRLERHRRITATGKETHEVQYGLTSLSPARAGARGILVLSRVCWGIENGLHRCRDVTFHEDATKLTQGQAGRVMAALNNLVIGLLRLAGETNLAAARRQHNADLGRSMALLTEADRPEAGSGTAHGTDRKTNSPWPPSTGTAMEAGPSAP